jgi:hypothetical protein
MGRHRSRGKRVDELPGPLDFQRVLAESATLGDSLADQVAKLSAEQEQLATDIAALEGELKSADQRLLLQKSMPHEQTYRDSSNDVAEEHVVAARDRLDTKRRELEVCRRTLDDMHRRLGELTQETASSPPQDAKQPSWWDGEIETTSGVEGEPHATVTYSMTRRQMAWVISTFALPLAALAALLLWMALR